MILQVDFASVKDDEHLLFDSDTEADFRLAVMAPPLDLKAMSQDGKAPLDKLFTLPAAPMALTADRKPVAGEPAAVDVKPPVKSVVVDTTAVQDFGIGRQEDGIAGLDHPAKRAKTGDASG